MFNFCSFFSFKIFFLCNWFFFSLFLFLYFLFILLISFLLSSLLSSLSPSSLSLFFYLSVIKRNGRQLRRDTMVFISCGEKEFFLGVEYSFYFCYPGSSFFSDFGDYFIFFIFFILFIFILFILFIYD